MIKKNSEIRYDLIKYLQDAEENSSLESLAHALFLLENPDDICFECESLYDDCDCINCLNEYEESCELHRCVCNKFAGKPSKNEIKDEAAVLIKQELTNEERNFLDLIKSRNIIRIIESIYFLLGGLTIENYYSNSDISKIKNEVNYYKNTPDIIKIFSNSFDFLKNRNDIKWYYDTYEVININDDIIKNYNLAIEIFDRYSDLKSFNQNINSILSSLVTNYKGSFFQKEFILKYLDRSRIDFKKFRILKSFVTRKNPNAKKQTKKKSRK